MLDKINRTLFKYFIIYEFDISLKDVRAQKFPRRDFFKTFTVGRK